GRHWFEILVDPANGRLELSRDGGAPLQTATLPAPLFAHETRIELALIDRRVLFAIDGVLQLDFACEAEAAPLQPTSRPITIGARGLAIQISRLQLFRDVYYTN